MGVIQPSCLNRSTPLQCSSLHAVPTRLSFAAQPRILPQLNRGLSQSSRGRGVEVKTTIQFDAAVEKQEDVETFNWLKFWWPVEFVYNLDTDRPSRIELMGDFFVVWRSKSGEWVTMKDMCPHRLAPLSEGRIEEDGTLMCSYHGWRFNDCGKCVKIPQAEDEKSHEAACNSKRSMARTFPCKVVGHMLWIWPDASEENYIDASATPVPLPEDYAAGIDERVEVGWSPGFSAVVPYTYDVLMENIADPSHFPFAHHKTFFGTRDMAKPLNMRRVDMLLPNSLAAVELDFHLGDQVAHFEIMSPNAILQQVGKPEDANSGKYVLMSTPINSMRAQLFIVAVSSVLEKRPPLILRLFPWLLHLGNISVLAGDNIILHEQGNNKQRLGRGAGPESYYMATSADLLVGIFRRWLATKGGGGPLQSEVDPPSLTRNEVLDRQSCHIAKCKVCQGGLQFVQRIKGVCKLLSQVSLLVAVAMFARSMQGALAYWKSVLPLISFSLFAFIEKQINKKLLPQFYFVDYVHAEKN